jgi:hypothetical protein
MLSLCFLHFHVITTWTFAPLCISHWFSAKDITWLGLFFHYSGLFLTRSLWCAVLLHDPSPVAVLSVVFRHPQFAVRAPTVKQIGYRNKIVQFSIRPYFSWTLSPVWQRIAVFQNALSELQIYRLCYTRANYPVRSLRRGVNVLSKPHRIQTLSRIDSTGCVFCICVCACRRSSEAQCASSTRTWQTGTTGTGRWQTSRTLWASTAAGGPWGAVWRDKTVTW